MRFECDDGIICRISFLLPDLSRVLYLRGDRPVAPRTWMVPAYGSADVPWDGRDRLDESAWPECGLRQTTNGDSIVIATNSMSLTIALAPFALTWALPDGKVFARERAAHATAFGKSGIRHAFARRDDDRFYGLGDKTGKLDLHGRRFRMAMLDSLGFDPERGDPLYKHWPFLITRDGATGVASGLFYDNMATATFDLGCEHDHYYGPYRSYEALDGDLDYYIFPGPGIADVTRKFLDLTGRPALPPRWNLGFAQSAMAIADGANAQEQMEAFIAKSAVEIRISAFHFGSGYPPSKAGVTSSLGTAINTPTRSRSCASFTQPACASSPISSLASSTTTLAMRRPNRPGPLSSERTANPQFRSSGMAGRPYRLHQPRRRRLVAARIAGTGARNWVGCGLERQQRIRLSNEDAVRAGFGERMPLDLARPLQPLLMTRASLHEQRRHAPQERQFSVTRAGCPGIQRYAQTWSGDNHTSWQSLKWNLRTGLQMSMSGMSNIGHDIAGFSGPVPDPELLVRWTQAGLLHPRFIMNSWKPDGIFTSPWLHPEATPAVREAIRLRYRLMPYFYSLMHAATDGETVLRPTFVAFPDDELCAEDSDELMLGPFLLAAPVVEPGERARRMYLPDGPACWFDFWTEEVLAPGAETIVAAPLDRLPLVVAEGGILPMTDSGEDFSRLHDEPTRALRICPGPAAGCRRFMLFEDDGISAAVNMTRVTFDLAWTVEEITLSVSAEGDYPLPYRQIRVISRQADRRRIRLNSAEGTPRLLLG